MHEDDLKEMKCVEEILEKDLRKELKKIKDAGTFSPGQTKTLCEAVDLMLKMKEYEEWLEDQGMSEYSQRNMARSYGYNSYAPNRSRVTGRFTSHRSYGSDGYSNHMMPYDMRNSGHSTKDRMIACLEDVMGEAKNEYEARMISDAINYIQGIEY